MGESAPLRAARRGLPKGTGWAMTHPRPEDAAWSGDTASSREVPQCGASPAWRQAQQSKCCLQPWGCGAGVAGHILCVTLPRGCCECTHPTDPLSGPTSSHWWELWVHTQALWDPLPLCPSAIHHTLLMEAPGCWSSSEGGTAPLCDLYSVTQELKIFPRVASTDPDLLSQMGGGGSGVSQGRASLESSPGKPRL